MFAFMKTSGRPRASRSLAAGLLAAGFFGLALPALGQVPHPNLARGFEPEKAYSFAAIDNINLFNGNLILNIPIGDEYRVSESLTYRLNLVHNGNVWDWTVIEGSSPSAIARPGAQFNAGLGWQLHYGKVLARNVAGINSSPYLVYVSPDGGGQGFSHNPEPNVFYTVDGLRLRLKESGPVVTVEFPDGAKHTFQRFSGAAEYSLTRMEDPFGNWMAISYTPNRWDITDSTGRSHMIVWLPWNVDGRFVNFPSSVRLATFNNTQSIYSFGYTSTTVQRPIQHNPASGIPVEAVVPLLTSITLPDTSTWDMPTSYYQTQRGPLGTSGNLLKIRTPNRGLLAWTIGAWRFPTETVPGPHGGNANAQFLAMTPGVIERKTLAADGTTVTGLTTYSSSFTHPSGWPLVRPVAKATTVIDPLNHRNVHYFSIFDGGSASHPAANLGYYGLPFSVEESDGGRFISRRTYKGTATVASRTEWVRYEADPSGGTAFGDKNRRVASTKVEWDGRYKTVDFSDWDGLGNYRHRALNGTYRTDGGPNWRNEYTGYNPGGLPASTAPWILNTYNVQWEEEYFGRSQREFLFDRGRLRYERRLVSKLANGPRSPEDTLVFFNRDAAGNATSEEYHGGYFNTISTAPLSYNYSLPGAPAVAIDMTYQYGNLATRKFRGANYYVIDNTNDRNTGFPASSRDAAGINTSYEYDAMGRQTWVKPAAGHDAWIQRVFQVASGNAQTQRARVYVYERPNNSPGSLIRESEYWFDEDGRLWREKRYTPAGLIERGHAYDAAGNKIATSEWKVGTPSNWTSLEEFDPFGRPGRMVKPDGKIIKTRYWGDWGLQKEWTVGTSRGAGGSINETWVGIDLDYDMMGRLSRAQEKEGATVANLDARYLYTPQGKLYQVQLTPRTGNAQYRHFDYDGRGYKLSETSPEGGTVNYSKIDAVGQANRKQQGGLDLGYSYDSYQRLIGVRDNTRNVDLKLWYYGDNTSGSFGAYKKNQVVKSVYYNRLRVPWAPTTTWVDLPVEENFVYDGRGGRMSSKTTKLNPSATNPYNSFTQSWTYDDLGKVLNEIYPRCAGGPCLAATSSPRNQGYTYDRGFLASVAGFATMTYHDNGTLARTLGPNGLSTWYDKDPNQIQRVANIRAQGGLLPMTELGYHVYDGGGNLVQMIRAGGGPMSFEEALDQARAAAGDTDDTGNGLVNAPEAIFQTYFLYDAFGRLRVHNDESGRFRTYDFNAFGSMIQIGSNDGGSTTLRNFAVSPTTNQLTTGVAYDARGNMTQRSLGSSTEIFEWDAFDQLTSQNFPATTHLYTASGERVWTFKFNVAANTIEDIFTLRGLGNQLLTVYRHTFNRNTSAEQWLWEEDYVYRPGGLLGKVTRHALPLTKIFFVTDRLGSVRMALQTNGTPIETHSYAAFGEQWRGIVNSTERMRFANHERDQGNPGAIDNLDYMHARYYSPDFGRFLTPDPAMSAYLDIPQSWNRYSYANNNPVNLVDPNGEALQALVAPAAIAAGTGAALNLGAKYLDAWVENYEVTSFEASKAAGIGAVDGLFTLGSGGTVRVFSGIWSVASGAYDRATDPSDKTRAGDLSSIAADFFGGLLGETLGNVTKASGKVITRKAIPRLTEAIARARKGIYAGSVSAAIHSQRLAKGKNMQKLYFVVDLATGKSATFTLDQLLELLAPDPQPQPAEPK